MIITTTLLLRRFFIYLPSNLLNIVWNFSRSSSFGETCTSLDEDALRQNCLKLSKSTGFPPPIALYAWLERFGVKKLDKSLSEYAAFNISVLSKVPFPSAEGDRRSSEGRVDLGIIQWWYKADEKATIKKMIKQKNKKLVRV